MPSFESYAIGEVLENNEFGITEVNDLVSIKSMIFNKAEYGKIVSLIKSNSLKEIEELPFGEGRSSYLEVMKLRDQRGKNYVVTVYDNDMLENDPQILDIFQLG